MRGPHGGLPSGRALLAGGRGSGPRPEVHEAFAAFGPQARRADNADLPWIAAEQLSGLGVGEIIDTGACTICSPGPAWHSHRRDGEDAGRSLALAWRN